MESIQQQQQQIKITQSELENLIKQKLQNKKASVHQQSQQENKQKKQNIPKLQLNIPKNCDTTTTKVSFIQSNALTSQRQQITQLSQNTQNSQRRRRKTQIIPKLTDDQNWKIFKKELENKNKKQIIQKKNLQDNYDFTNNVDYQKHVNQKILEKQYKSKRKTSYQSGSTFLSPQTNTNKYIKTRQFLQTFVPLDDNKSSQKQVKIPRLFQFNSQNNSTLLGDQSTNMGINSTNREQQSMTQHNFSQIMKTQNNSVIYQNQQLNQQNKNTKSKTSNNSIIQSPRKFQNSSIQSPYKNKNQQKQLNFPNLVKKRDSNFSSLQQSFLQRIQDSSNQKEIKDTQQYKKVEAKINAFVDNLDDSQNEAGKIQKMRNSVLQHSLISQEIQSTSKLVQQQESQIKRQSMSPTKNNIIQEENSEFGFNSQEKIFQQRNNVFNRDSYRQSPKKSILNSNFSESQLLNNRNQKKSSFKTSQLVQNVEDAKSFRRHLSKKLSYLHYLQMDEDYYQPIITESQKNVIFGRLKYNIANDITCIDKLSPVEPDILLYLQRIETSFKTIQKQVSVMGLQYIIEGLFQNYRYLLFLVLDKNKKIVNSLKSEGMAAKILSQNFKKYFYSEQQPNRCELVFRYVILQDLKDIQELFSQEEKRLTTINLHSLQENIGQIKEEMVNSQKNYIQQCTEDGERKKLNLLKIQQQIEQNKHFSFDSYTNAADRIKKQLNILQKDRMGILQYIRPDQIETYNLTNDTVKYLKETVNDQ